MLSAFKQKTHKETQLLSTVSTVGKITLMEDAQHIMHAVTTVTSYAHNHRRFLLNFGEAKFRQI